MEYPNTVQIETTTGCNAKCSFCPHSTMNRKKPVRMSDELFRKIIDEIGSWNRGVSICPFLTNEPFFDPEIIEKCSYIKEKAPEAGVTFFTNGSLLNEKNVVEIAKVGNVQSIFISLHHIDADEYYADTGLRFWKTIHCIDVAYPIIPQKITLLRVQDGNDEKDQEFIKFCNDRWPYAKTQLGYRYNWKGDINSFIDYRNTLYQKCTRTWSMTIMVDGTVSLCCLDQNGEYALGDVSKDTLLDVFNNEVSRKYRNNNKVENTPCNRCNMT